MKYLVVFGLVLAFIGIMLWGFWKPEEQSQAEREVDANRLRLWKEAERSKE